MRDVAEMGSPACRLAAHVQAELGKVVFGMEEATHALSVALIAGGHVLVQGVPGLGKTLLAKSFAALIGGRFKRIQCTADLMPADITGIHVYRDSQFELVPGPVFANVLLVDEINRTGPKTQSALLQAMEEGCVTIDRTTYPLPEHFVVMASQNPADFEGTYPLPESQLDRFLLRLDLGYPAAGHEQQVLMTYDQPGGGHGREPGGGETDIAPLPEDLLAEARAEAAGVHVSDALYRYGVELAAASRSHPQLSLGLSTRGALSLMRCARAVAALRGAAFATPDDIKRVARAVMAHRLVLSPEAALDGVQAAEVVDALLAEVRVPRE